ncbi:GNAT family N-acetyltransferase [Streptomyces sp. IBSBF 2435]|uniref:GNAT family N-acetyltransferase n=1 Tax=Streptomyces sp. IBSBF 2435 TaxID=2903531 RepID=UPI002FDC012C
MSERPPFELRELAVAPHLSGRGVGAALHDALTAATPPGPRWLITHPYGAPALALYRSRGWQTTRNLPAPGRTGAVRLLMHCPH